MPYEPWSAYSLTFLSEKSKNSNLFKSPFVGFSSSYQLNAISNYLFIFQLRKLHLRKLKRLPKVTYLVVQLIFKPLSPLPCYPRNKQVMIPGKLVPTS